MSEPVRVLHVLANTNLGGAESRIMDIYRNIDRTKVQFDFMVHSPEKGFFEDEINALGGHVYRVIRFRMINHPVYKHAWKKFFRAHRGEFKAVQGHITSSAAIYLPIAKKSGVPITIAHARSAGVDAGIKGLLTRFMRRNLYKKADYCFACSAAAAVSVFGERAYEAGLTTFIPNAIECGKFRFDPVMREKKRMELSLKDKFVIGHVGRFHYAKNHEYLLAVFDKLLKKLADEKSSTDVALILFGEGSRREEMKALSESLGISDKIIFAGNHKDIYNYYNAMDYFIYPSRYEGMPGTIVEAQTNGIMTLMSDAVCDEVIATELVKKLSIDEDPAVWADAVYEDIKYLIGHDNMRPDNVYEYAELMAESGFDVKEQARELIGFYTGEAL